MENLHEIGLIQLLQIPVWKLCFLRAKRRQFLTRFARGYCVSMSYCSSAEPG